MKPLKRFCAILGGVAGLLVCTAHAEEDFSHNALVKWCIQVEINNVAALPRVQELRQLARTHHDNDVRAAASRELHRWHALAVQGGYNEGVRRVMEIRQQNNQHFMEFYMTRQFARTLAREFRANY